MLDQRVQHVRVTVDQVGDGIAAWMQDPDDGSRACSDLHRDLRRREAVDHPPEPLVGQVGDTLSFSADVTDVWSDVGVRRVGLRRRCDCAGSLVHARVHHRRASRPSRSPRRLRTGKRASRNGRGDRSTRVVIQSPPPPPPRPTRRPPASAPTAASGARDPARCRRLHEGRIRGGWNNRARLQGHDEDRRHRGGLHWILREAHAWQAGHDLPLHRSRRAASPYRGPAGDAAAGHLQRCGQRLDARHARSRTGGRWPSSWLPRSRASRRVRT